MSNYTQYSFKYTVFIVFFTRSNRKYFIEAIWVVLATFACVLMNSLRIRFLEETRKHAIFVGIDKFQKKTIETPNKFYTLEKVVLSKFIKRY